MHYIKLLLILLVCTICLGNMLFGTGCSITKSDINALDTLKICLGGEPDKLNPQDANTAYLASLAFISHSGLLMCDEDGNPTYACAQRCQVSQDGLVYRFTLRDDLKWSDGSLLNSYDFCRSWQQTGGAQSTSANKYMFSCIDGYDTGVLNVTALDNGRILQVVLSEPCPYFLELCTLPAFFPIKETDVNKYSQEGFISNGPFVLKEWNHSRSMIFTKNPYWFDCENVSLNKLELMLSDSGAAIYAAYKSGNIDFTDIIPDDEVGGLKNDITLKRCDMLGTYFISFNVNSKIFSKFNKEDAATFRKALGLLINRHKIINTVCIGGQKAARQFLPIGLITGTSQYVTSDSQYITDKNQAIQMLESIGYIFDNNCKLSAQTPITIDYLTNENGAQAGIPQSIQADYANIGITLNIVQQDSATFLESKRNGNFDMAKNGWLADYNDVINFLEIHESSSPNNRSGFGKEINGYAPDWSEYDTLIGLIRADTDANVRNDLATRAQAILMDTGAVCPVYYYSDLYLIRENISGVYTSCYGHKYFMYASVS